MGVLHSRHVFTRVLHTGFQIRNHTWDFTLQFPDIWWFHTNMLMLSKEQQNHQTIALTTLKRCLTVSNMRLHTLNEKKWKKKQQKILIFEKFPDFFLQFSADFSRRLFRAEDHKSPMRKYFRNYFRLRSKCILFNFSAWLQYRRLV